MADNPTGQMGFLDHLEELRRTLFWVAGIVAVGTVVTWFFSDTIVDLLLRPAREGGQETLYFSAPMEAFMLKLKASVVVGILIGFPLILLHFVKAETELLVQLNFLVKSVILVYAFIWANKHFLRLKL